MKKNMIAGVCGLALMSAVASAATAQQAQGSSPAANPPRQKGASPAIFYGRNVTNTTQYIFFGSSATNATAPLPEENLYTVYPGRAFGLELQYRY